MITTLNQIRAHRPCRNGWEKLLRHLNKTTADDEPLPISTILDSNGLDDALWCLRAVEGRDREIRLYAVWCARQVQHLVTDPRSLAVLELAERFARGRASAAELRKAEEAARTAAAARAAAAAAARAALSTTEDEASEAAWAVEQAAYAAAAAAGAARAALSTTEDEASEAAVAAAEEAEAAYAAGAESAAQAAELRRICQEIEAGRDPYLEEDGR